MKKKLQTQRLFAFLAIAMLSIGLAQSAPMYNIPMVLTQPNGEEIHCFASGDEFHNWLHDEDGYTIMQHPQTGYYVYALQDGEFVKPSEFMVGQVDPPKVGFTKFVNLSEKVVEAKRREMEKKVYNPEIKGFKDDKGTGSLSNIVIYIKFSNETLPNEEFGYYSDLYDKVEGPSLIHYFRDVSYNTLDINTTYLPVPSGGLVVWYTDSNPRSYYRPYNATTNTNGYDPNANSGATSRRIREHTLLQNAVNAVKASIPAGFNVDANNDGYVDCVSFIVSGGPDGWSDLLWPHRWVLYTYNVTINSKRVYDYTFQLQYTSSAQNTRMRLGTVAHEMFHVIGAPDLYRYTNTSITPVGSWDLMASTGNTPQQMTAYMKYLYGGWIDRIPDIAESGTYTLNQLESSTQNCFRIPSGKTHTEYYVVEYRRKNEMYDNIIPAAGLLVYRINDRLVGVGNAQGPPDELYIYRPAGSPSGNGAITLANFSTEANRTIFNKTTDPYPFISDGNADEISILNVGSASGSTMTFSVNIDYEYQRAMNYYKYITTSGFNPLYASSNVPVAIKLTPEELGPFVGKFISKVEFIVKSGSGTGITVKIWEGTENNEPSDLVYSQDVSGEVSFDNFTLHQLTSPLQIKADKDYWVGYEINSTGYGNPFARDNGPMVPGKGGWIKYQGVWKQFTEISSVYNYNLLISAIIQNLSGVSVEPNAITDKALKVSNYPNPFDGNSTIAYSLHSRSMVNIKLFNIMGQEIATLVSGMKDSGDHSFELSGATLPSGVYFYRVEINGNAAGAVTNKLVKQ